MDEIEPHTFRSLLEILKFSNQNEVRYTVFRCVSCLNIWSAVITMSRERTGLLEKLGNIFW